MMQKKKHSLHFFFLVVIGHFLLCACQPKNSEPDEQAEPKQYRVAIELVVENEALADSLLYRLGETALTRYRWKNHLVLFGEVEDTLGINSLIRQSGISLQIKRYNTPMYVFDRATHCGDTIIVKPWKDYLLTANLVADSAMQQEYMHYHEVQFEEWPEVAEGFCNANFQQLLMFRNGRQLMLVISIPADKTLDELNPKTEENNPRMVDWNQRMSQYQEGIEGTDPDETWVFLSPAEVEIK